MKQFDHLSSVCTFEQEKIICRWQFSRCAVTDISNHYCLIIITLGNYIWKCCLSQSWRFIIWGHQWAKHINSGKVANVWLFGKADWFCLLCEISFVGFGFVFIWLVWSGWAVWHKRSSGMGGSWWLGRIPRQPQPYHNCFLNLRNGRDIAVVQPFAKHCPVSHQIFPEMQKEDLTRAMESFTEA